jgi:hypothetical protein
MEIADVLQHLTEENVWGKVVSYEPITLGAGGAKLFTVNDGVKNYVLKVAHESFLSEEGRFVSYRKEYDFYQLNRDLQLPFVPNILYAEEHPEYGLLLVMECYEAITHDQWDPELQKRALDVCAQLNCVPVETLEPLGVQWNPTQIDEEFTRNAYQNWLEVISKHEGRFDRNLLDMLYQNLDEVCTVLNSKPQYVCHGDFHPENVLWDGTNLYICDWQGIHIGKCAGDMSFFQSRGMGMGISMDADELLSYYCERLSEYKGVKIDPETIRKECSASALLTTFSFWAYYLKNAPYERVAEHFNEMVEAARVLTILK